MTGKIEWLFLASQDTEEQNLNERGFATKIRKWLVP